MKGRVFLGDFPGARPFVFRVFRAVQQGSSKRNRVGARKDVRDRAKIVHVGVHVAGGHLEVAVAHRPLQPDAVEAALGEQRSEGVAGVVEPHRPRDGLRPQPHLAALAVALDVVREAFGVVFPPLRLAAAADVVVPIDDPGPPKDPAGEHRQVGGGGMPLAVLRREDELRARLLHCVFQEGYELVGDGQRVHVAALRRRALVRAVDRDRPGVEVDVRLPKGEELPLA